MVRSGAQRIDTAWHSQGFIITCNGQTISQVGWAVLHCHHHRGQMAATSQRLCMGQPLCYGNRGISVWFSLYLPSHPRCWTPSMTLFANVQLPDGFLTGQLLLLPGGCLTLQLLVHSLASYMSDPLVTPRFCCLLWNASIVPSRMKTSQHVELVTPIF